MKLVWGVEYLHDIIMWVLITYDIKFPWINTEIQNRDQINGAFYLVACRCNFRGKKPSDETSDNEEENVTRHNGGRTSRCDVTWRFWLKWARATSRHHQTTSSVVIVCGTEVNIMFSDWFLSLFGSLTLKKTRQITQVTQAFVPKHGCALAETRVLFLTSCHRGRSLGVCSMCFCHSSVWHPAFLLKEMVSSWYVPTARGRPPPHPASFSSPDCRFISRVSPGHDYTLRLFSSPPFLFFFWDILKALHRKHAYQEQNALAIRSISFRKMPEDYL